MSQDTFSLQEASGLTAENLVKWAQQEAYKIFLNRKFRQILEFEKLPQTEQDRIFNELVVSSLLIMMLTLEAPDINAPEAIKDFLLEIKDEIPKKHLQSLKDLGIENNYRQDWEKLIQMRYREYQEDRLGMREAAMELTSKESPLTTEKLRDIGLLLPPQVVGMGTLSHIRRGKIEENDPLNKIILRWIGDLFLPVRLMTEGRKYSRWQRTLLHLRRRLLRRRLHL